MKAKAAVDRRLDRHFATLRTGAFHAGNWQRYAAVTGSALAMVTSAAASVVYSGPLNQSSPRVSTNNQPFASTGVGLNTAGGSPLYATCGCRIGFFVGVSQQSGSGGGAGKAAIYGGAFGFAHSSGNPFAKQFAPGSRISGAQGFYSGPNYLGLQVHGPNGASSTNFSVGLPPNQTGTVGFDFRRSYGAQPDYGWVRLSFTVGENQLANQITVLDWAYADDGNGILAGEQVEATPEPSTAALSLLAAGALGVTALRRRRKTTA